MAGASHLVLMPGVTHLDPASAVFEAMLQGWALQQRTRLLKAETISSRLRLARRVAEFVNEYPWQWQSADVEAFIDSCRNRREPIVVSTARLYETTLRMFLQYVSDPRYGWTGECLAVRLTEQCEPMRVERGAAQVDRLLGRRRAEPWIRRRVLGMVSHRLVP